MNRHQITVDKELKTYTYTTGHYPGDWKNASNVPKTTMKTLTRQEFLELAYQKGIEIYVVDGAEFDHPIFAGKVQKLREPHEFEVL